MTKVIKNWLGNEAKITGICAALSALALVFSITGLFSSFLPFDIAWLAVLLCGIPILVGAFLRPCF